MILSFRDKDTAALFDGKRSRRIPADLAQRALRKLVLLDTAVKLDDLRVPPGNMLERLTGDRSGQHSIRVNDQWRICFEWFDGDAHNVEFVDYHE